MFNNLLDYDSNFNEYYTAAQDIYPEERDLEHLIQLVEEKKREILDLREISDQLSNTADSKKIEKLAKEATLHLLAIQALSKKILLENQSLLHHLKETHLN